MSNILKPGQGSVKCLVFYKSCVTITVITQLKEANRDGNLLI